MHTSFYFIIVPKTCQTEQNEKGACCSGAGISNKKKRVRQRDRLKNKKQTRVKPMTETCEPNKICGPNRVSRWKNREPSRAQCRPRKPNGTDAFMLQLFYGSVRQFTSQRPCDAFHCSSTPSMPLMVLASILTRATGNNCMARAKLGPFMRYNIPDGTFNINKLDG